MKILKLNSKVTDTATGLSGMVTMLHVDMNGDKTYHFQPARISGKTKVPIDGIWAVENRLTGAELIEAPLLPFEVLGTEVEDIATGFKGMAVSLALHATGCVHFNVQPKGVDEEGNPIKVQNFSSLRLKGKAMKSQTESEKESERKSKPSPGPALMPPKFG